ncbi:pancreatic lipase-related protein 2 [Scaptodrosophila lebanonensis]|uniref:Pancreatic lipase-related protein 2 n=1 Tax=Drosophila lebanonensis TaxID=7225 RepID=A0A6J2UBU8_DROLE|nr:pancreatic lipase-related protein 2 [Scaptodrosophila lebanonensis]
MKTSYCLMALFWQVWGVQALSLDSLVGQSKIYYQRPARLGSPRELPLESVDQLETVESLKLIVHGFLGSRTHGSIMPLANAYKAQGFANILIADWSPASSLDYAKSRRAVGKVALHLAKQLQLFLERHNISNEAVHVIGHSLGAHIAGRIGHHFNGSLGRVTGLDPALPLFSPRSEDSLRANAARFVDVVHTDYPFFGDLTPRGTADFYPNFGRTPQPGCEDVDLLAASKLILEAYSCSHNRAVLFYAESIGMPKNFPAMPCTLKDIKGRNIKGCLKKTSELNSNSSAIEAADAATDETQAVYMGEHVTRSATSFYYLKTNAVPPFGQGVQAKFN